jgi:hypothetical protein
MDKQAAERIISLAMKWQDPGPWHVAYSAAEDCRKSRDQSSASAAHAFKPKQSPHDDDEEDIAEPNREDKFRDLSRRDAELWAIAAAISQISCAITPRPFFSTFPKSIS